MGRRSRARSTTAPGPAAKATKASRPPAGARRPKAAAAGRRAGSRRAAAAGDGARAPRRREGALDRLSPVRRVLARFIGFALLVAIATVAGIAGLGGTLGPLIVFAYTVVAAGVVFRWAQGHLAGQAMSDEDRMMQTLAGGLLVMSVLLATVSAIVLTAV